MFNGLTLRSSGGMFYILTCTNSITEETFAIFFFFFTSLLLFWGSQRAILDCPLKVWTVPDNPAALRLQHYTLLFDVPESKMNKKKGGEYV